MNKFYVYYEEESGHIQLLSPVKNDAYPACSVTTIDYDLASKFILGEWNMSEWHIASESTYDHGILIENNRDLRLFSGDKIESIQRETVSSKATCAIFVTVYTKSNIFEVSIPPNLIGVKLPKLEKDDMTFFLTKRNDPTQVISEFTVEIAELFTHGWVQLPFKSTLDDFSVFTKKQFRNYQLKMKKRVAIATPHNGRINTLVPFTKIKNQELVEGSINVVHNINTNTLTISLVDLDFTELSQVVQTTGSLFLTKENDPTILIDIVKFNWGDFTASSSINIKLNKKVGIFGIASYPYADHLTFMRK